MIRNYHYIIVLNLIINGLPSKPISDTLKLTLESLIVLNLIINGLPSKLKVVIRLL